MMTVGNRELAIQKTLKYEGGYTNNPEDPGGPTNWGITIADARKYWKADADSADVKEMPLSVAVEIYRKHYWAPVNGDALPAGLDFAVFDFAVNSGITRALTYYSKTSGNTVTRIEQICDARLQFLKGLKTWPTFGHGWASRVADVKQSAKNMALAQPPVAPIPAPPDISRPEPVPTRPAFSWAQFFTDLINAIFKRKG
jgi:lysozyme family protein